MRQLLLAGLIAGCACASIGPPPQNTERYAGLLPVPTTLLYRQWFQHVEACSGLTADLSLVHFYVAPKPILTLAGRGGLFLGLYYHDDHAIILGLYETMDSVVVSHEELHFLLRENGQSSDEDMHPSRFFRDLCGKVIGPYST